MTLAKDLKRLVQVLAQYGHPIDSYLRPGLQRSDTSIYLASLKLVIPTDLYELYEWANGTTAECDIPLFDEHFFLPIDHALYEYNQFVPAFSRLDPDIDINYAFCFPFAHFMGSCYTIYCSPHNIRGFIHPIIHVFQGSHVRFINLPSLVRTITQWYLSGAYDLETIDESLQKSIWRSLNPGVEIS